jgi:hypothetical protein
VCALLGSTSLLLNHTFRLPVRPARKGTDPGRVPEGGWRESKCTQFTDTTKSLLSYEVADGDARANRCGTMPREELPET